jgi:hypothetical protein
MSYVEKFNVDLSEWSLAPFKRAVDFHLNGPRGLNLTPVLIFTKYYTHFHACRLRKELAQLDQPISKLADAEKQQLHERVFNQGSLVDMRSLFGFLVDHLGQRQALDPHSKDDALWRLVEFFTKSGIEEIAAHSKDTFNTIAD